MSDRPEVSQLVQQPSFKNPPVVETALSIQFNEIAGFNNTHFGLFHQEIKSKYPIINEQPRLDPVIERFPGPVFSGRPRFKVESSVIPQRMWFVDESNAEMVQLQPDRIVFNWRRTDDGVEYPRFSTNRPKCVDAYLKFVNFCEQHHINLPSPNLIEVAYVNHFDPVEGETAIDTFARSFVGLEWEGSNDFLPRSPETALFNRVYEIEEAKGRLYAEASIVPSGESGGRVQLRLTARVIHGEQSSEVGESLQLAHDWVVNGFVSLTTPEMHSLWGLNS